MERCDLGGGDEESLADDEEEKEGMLMPHASETIVRSDAICE